MFSRLSYDIKAILQRDPAARNGFEVFLLYPGLHAVIWHRISHWFYKKNLKFIARWISQFARSLTGIEIHPGATIGKGVFIDHGMGVVIGETAVVGDNCTIYQGVTLGGTGKETGKRHPTLKEHVMVGSGAKILGPFTVGAYSKIAANAVVLNEVGEYCTCVGVPARVVKQNGVRVAEVEELDQIRIPDPVSMELCKLSVKLERLEKLVGEKQNEEEHSIKQDDIDNGK